MLPEILPLVQILFSEQPNISEQMQRSRNMLMWTWFEKKGVYILGISAFPKKAWQSKSP